MNAPLTQIGNWQQYQPDASGYEMEYHTISKQLFDQQNVYFVKNTQTPPIVWSPANESEDSLRKKLVYPSDVMMRANLGYPSREADGISYNQMFSALTTEAYTRGQRGTEDSVAPNWDDAPVFLSHTFFPTITYSDLSAVEDVKQDTMRKRLIKLRAQGKSTGGYTCLPWMAVYCSFAPTPSVIGHTPDWHPMQNSRGGVVNVDFARIRDSNAVLSIASAIKSTNPVNGSYIWLTKCTSDSFDDSVKLAPLRGASMGLAVCAAILNGPPIMYTGFVKKLPGISKFATDGTAIQAAHTDDVVEDVQGLPVKMAWAVEVNFPLVIPHKSMMGQPLQDLLTRMPNQGMLYSYVTQAYSTSESDQGIPYWSRKSPILLATSLPEAVQLAAYAYIQYMIRGDSRLSQQMSVEGQAYGEGLQLMLDDAIPNKKKMAGRAKDAARARQIDAPAATEQSIANRQHRMEATTAKLLSQRAEKKDKAAARAEVQREKAQVKQKENEELKGYREVRQKRTAVRKEKDAKKVKVIDRIKGKAVKHDNPQPRRVKSNTRSTSVPAAPMRPPREQDEAAAASASSDRKAVDLALNTMQNLLDRTEAPDAVVEAFDRVSKDARRDPLNSANILHSFITEEMGATNKFKPEALLAEKTLRRQLSAALPGEEEGAGDERRKPRVSD